MIKKFLFLFLTFVQLTFATDSIVYLEKEDLFISLGYDSKVVTVFKEGDFGEGGGGNRPIKSLEESDNGEIFLYFPARYRIDTRNCPRKVLKKVPISVIKFFTFEIMGKTTRVSMDEVFSFDIHFSDIVDFNEVTSEKLFGLTLKDTQIFLAENLVSIELDAIIEP